MFDSESDADTFAASLDRETGEIGEWWARVAEWRVADVPRPSGPTQPEDERRNVQVKLRLPTREALRLDRLAETWGVTRSAAVVRMIAREP